MTDNVEKKPDAIALAGASKADLDEGQGLGGAPKAPAEQSNEPPKKDPAREETFGTDDKADKKDDTAKEPVKKDVKKDETKKEDKTFDGPLKSYISMDDPAAQGAIDVLKEAGVDPNEANAFFTKAVASGDIADVDWAAIEKRIGPAKAFLVKSGVTAYYAAEKTKVDATVNATIEVFGGKDNWETVKAWSKAKEKTDPAFAQKVDAIRDLLNTGGSTADIGARELLRLYNSDATTKGLHTRKLVTGDNTGQVIGTPLTRADYVKALHAAHDRGAKPVEIAELDQRRKAGITAGI